MNAQSQQSAGAGHEQRDADTLGLTMIAAFLLLVIAVCFLCVFGLLGILRRAQSADKLARAEATDRSVMFPPPRLQASPGTELRASQETAKAKLDSYGWIDRKAGIAHIPIQRAMQLILERGLPEVGAGQTRLQLMQGRPNASNATQMPETTP